MNLSRPTVRVFSGSMLLINRFLLSKYSRPIFSASIAVFLVKIVQNINRGLYFVMRKLFLLENCFSLRYERMSVKLLKLNW